VELLSPIAGHCHSPSNLLQFIDKAERIIGKGGATVVALRKKIMKRGPFIAMMIGSAFNLNAQSPPVTVKCDLTVGINKYYSKAPALDSIMSYYTTGILPGVSVAVYHAGEGWWAGSKGYADLEKKLPMENCHLQYLQSVSKTYMAVEILQLMEKGKIVLDDPITNYLPARYSRHLKDPEKITVRMLLNHRSGVPEYNEQPGFVSQVVLHPLKNFTAGECLQAIHQKDFNFEPGTKYQYINTNYLLLSLIGDAITGDHAAYIREHIFKKLGLNNSYYANGYDYLKNLYLPESYWDVFNNGIAVNVTPFQQMTVACSKGDDGIVCSTIDAVKFLKGLMEGQLLNERSMELLFDFVKDEQGHKRYSTGLIYFDLGGTPAYGHGGGGIGAGCGLLYIPSRKTYVFLSTNLGCFIDSKLSAKAAEMKDAILATLLN
jgi:D-alanyl-D-alanine carboxypeptidase